MNESSIARPVLFLDFDDVLCLNHPYGGRHLLMRPQPADLHLRLWHPPALAALLEVVRRTRPSIVLTTKWLQFLDLTSARELFNRTGADLLAQLLHSHGEAPQIVGKTRLKAIEAWMATHGLPEAYAILDDMESGTDLANSRHDAAGRVFFCEPSRGFDTHHIAGVINALRTPGQ